MANLLFSNIRKSNIFRIMLLLQLEKAYNISLTITAVI